MRNTSIQGNIRFVSLLKGLTRPDFYSWCPVLLGSQIRRNFRFQVVVADAIVNFLRPIRERTEELNKDKLMLWELLRTNSQRVRTVAQQTVEEARIAMGMDYVPDVKSKKTSSTK